MDDQLFHRISIVDFQNLFKFFRLLFSDPRLDRDFCLRFRKNLIQKPVQFFRKCQKTGSASFCHYGLGRTSQIQIDLRVSILGKFFRRTQKIFRAVRQNLRNCVHPLIIFRQDILPFPAAQMSVLVRIDKRDKIFVHTVKTTVKGIAEHISCDSLQWRGIYFHMFLLFFTTLLYNSSLRQNEMAYAISSYNCATFSA